MAHKKIVKILVISILCCLTLTNAYASFAKIKMPEPVVQCSKQVLQLQFKMRLLWQDQAVFTHNYIVSALANFEDKDIAYQRLQANQIGISNALKAYYSKSYVKKLNSLLDENLFITNQIIELAKTNDQNALSKAQEQWQVNIEKVAEALNDMNLVWDKKIVQPILYAHIKFVMGEIAARLSTAWTADIEYYDQDKMKLLEMADLIADGIRQQFPDKFPS